METVAVIIRVIVGQGQGHAYAEIHPATIASLKAKGYWVLIDPEDDRAADLWGVFMSDQKPR